MNRGKLDLFSRPNRQRPLPWSLLIVLCFGLIASLAQQLPAAAEELTPLATPQPHFVHITATGFEPASITIPAGDGVVWINDQSSPVTFIQITPYQIFLPTIQNNKGVEASGQETTVILGTVMLRT